MKIKEKILYTLRLSIILLIIRAYYQFYKLYAVDGIIMATFLATLILLPIIILTVVFE